MRRAILVLVLVVVPLAVGCRKSDPNRLTVAMMPKSKGNPYFVAAHRGADQAADELGIKLLWDGPTETDPAKQNEVVEAWITRGVDVIAVSVENREGLATVLRKARAKGIKIVTWDSDAPEDARDFLVNQATPEGIGTVLADRAATLLGGKGEFAVITASLTAANQNTWLEFIRARMKEKHPGLELVAVRPSDDKQDLAFVEAQNILKVYPNVKLIMGIASPAVPGAAEAVKQAGRSDVKVIGLALPIACRKYIHEGAIDSIVLWNVNDLGYLTVHVANALGRGKLKPGITSLAAGHLGTVEVKGTQVLLGIPMVFDNANVDHYDF